MSGKRQTNDEARRLVLYLGDELSAEQREAMERELAENPALSRELEALHAVHRRLMRSADVRVVDTSRQHRATRRVMSAMEEWNDQRLAAAAQSAKPAVSYPWWAYPLAAAAVLILGFLLYFGFSSNIPGPTHLDSDFADQRRLRDPDFALRDLRYQWALESGPQPVSLAFGMVDDFTRHDELRRAERELAQVTASLSEWDLFEHEPSEQ